MKRLVIEFIVFFSIILFAFESHAQSVVKESLHFRSDVLGRDVRYSIYLPEDYHTSERKYPALYLLHGWGGDETVWILRGEVKRIADTAISSGKAVPMIIIMPDAGETWYVNSYDGKVRYEDMFFTELIPYMEQTFRIRSEKECRAIAGLSMGGYGAFLYSLHHPDMFSCCAPISAAIYTDEIMEKSKGGRRSELFDSLYGPGNLTPHWEKNSVLHILNEKEGYEFPNVRYYIDCGDEDTLLHGNNLIHEIFMRNKIKHEFRVRDGGHTWPYWRTSLPEVLEFISLSFNRS